MINTHISFFPRYYQEKMTVKSNVVSSMSNKTSGGVGRVTKGFSLIFLSHTIRKQLRASALDAEISLQLTTQIYGFSSCNFSS